ncbi:unnamed protein product [Paramecium primaurelia]|uniref:RING-type domain-containing protein n=4 Tax=Paramecium TaxID=5884 RepID=A0BTR3_PARTE|nr:uncharacterized protein GSPATT00032162001 [Paramecium tetraurelia]CAD8103007.1 unnamed protein product [Paramecium primaurelia]CAD8188498.1 unnamed protein product [Paramecium octaurelia]CAD8205173.1 unnamed protein product [Paramecium pentaurelia]CAK61930.1 unnamed protein product [Paramecium tetraurelia]|eukprot:XP_001429328.1 hypothetical protein (macronuclear) [Paramecium tetraurelia strain d4-2]
MEGTDSYNYDEMDLDELMLPPPTLIRQNAFIEEEEETPQFILTTQTDSSYKEEECPICFCHLNEENTVKLLCGHVLCQDDLNQIISIQHSQTLKCHICRALQIVNQSFICIK